MSEALPGILLEAGHLKIIYSEFLEVRKRGEVMQDIPAEEFRSEPRTTGPQAYPEPFDEREETEVVRFFEWSWPQVLQTGRAVRGEGVVKV